MRKIFLMVLVVLLVLPGFGAWIASSDSSMTQIGATNSWYVPTAGGKIGMVTLLVNYTKGDETNASITIQYCMTAAVPAATTIYNFPEASSAGVISSLTRTITATGKYALPVEIPARAKYIIITIANTGGTPTGTVDLTGFVD